MLTVPPAILDILELQPGMTVGLSVENGRLLVEPQRRPRYTLDELLARCDPTIEVTPEEQEWLDGPPIGRELL